MNSNITKGDEVKESVNPFKVGDILIGEKIFYGLYPVFFEVVRCTKKQVVVKELITSCDSGNCVWGYKKPCPGEYFSEETFTGEIDKEEWGAYSSYINGIYVILWGGQPAFCHNVLV